jgi:hypothetical protein
LHCIEFLPKSRPDVVTRFFEKVFTIDVLFALLQRDDHSTRVLLLKLLEFFLKDPKNATTFKQMNGFELLGYQLRCCPVNDELFGVLLSLMLGKPTNKFTSLRISNVQNYLYMKDLKAVLRIEMVIILCCECDFLLAPFLFQEGIS